MSADRLRSLEKVIDRSRRRFRETGAALGKIRDEKLYKVSLFDSFESYVGHRWEMGKSQAYRLIEASRVMENLSPIGDAPPANEAQARVLARLSPVEQKRVWREFLESGAEQTASNIKRFVRGDRREDPGPSKGPDRRDRRRLQKGGPGNDESDRPGEKRLVEDHFQTGRAALEPVHEGQDNFEALKRRADEWKTTFSPK